jgi:hypothetical protein
LTANSRYDRIFFMTYSQANSIQPNDPTRQNSENAAERKFTSNNSKGQFHSCSLVRGGSIIMSEDLQTSLKSEGSPGQIITPIAELNPTIQK